MLVILWFRLFCGILTFIESLNCGRKGVESRHLVLFVGAFCVFCALLRCSHNTACNLSRPSISQEPTGCSNIGDSNCRALQNKLSRLLFGSRQEALVLPDPRFMIDTTRRGMSAPRRTCNIAAWRICKMQWVFLVNRELPPGHADVVQRFLLSNQKGHAVTLHALLWWSLYRNRCTGL